MAPRMLMTPTLPVALGAGAAAEGDCARTTATIRRPAAARAAVCIINLEFTLFSLFIGAIRKKAGTTASQLNSSFPTPPAGKTKVLETRKYSRRASVPAMLPLTVAAPLGCVLVQKDASRAP